MDINEREPNDRLRALLRDAGWTQEGLARAVNALGGEIGDDLRYDRSAVAHWLTGTEPRGPVPQLVAEALTRRMGRTVTPQEAGFRSDPATDRTETPGTDPLEGIAALHRAATGTSGSPPSQRRPYRAADAQVPPRPVPRLLVPPGRRKDPEERTFPSPRVAALDDAVRFFATAIDAHGGLHARTALAAYLADDVAPLLRAPMASGERSQILVASSRLCMLLGRMYADGLQQGVAQHYFTYAHQLAGEAGDQDAWATVLRMMSAQARRLGHTADALRLAEAAAEAVTSAAPARRAFVQAQLAVVQAETGDGSAARATLAAAESAAGYASHEQHAQGAPAPPDGRQDGQPAPHVRQPAAQEKHAQAEQAREQHAQEQHAQEPSYAKQPPPSAGSGTTSVRQPGDGPFDTYPAAALAFQRSLVLEALGDIPGAVHALERSRSLRGPSDVRGHALSEARLGRVLLRQGRLDEACHAWHGFLDHHGRLSSGEARRELYEARRALRPYRTHRAAALLLERARRYTL